jgi:hypothetical protein
MINAVLSRITSENNYPTARRNKTDLLAQHESRLVTNTTVRRYIPTRKTASFSVLFSLSLSLCLLHRQQKEKLLLLSLYLRLNVRCAEYSTSSSVSVLLTQKLARAQQDIPENTPHP